MRVGGDSTEPGGAGPTEIGSLYVHVPFCARRCPYCDFAIEVKGNPSLSDWTEAISAEWERHLRDDRLRVAERLASIYVGGGTPSTLGPGLAAALVSCVGAERVPRESGEWTIEVNPESFDLDMARAWRRAGVTRISIGVQSFHEPALRWMARLHGPEGAEKALRTARSAGFAAVSVDLIFGLPDRLARSWTADLDRAIALGVPHVSLYGLTIEPGTPLDRAIAQGREAAPDEHRYEAEYLEAAERLVAEGYDHYEVSSFARPGHRALHNPVYWSGRPYLGVGNGAHSYAPPRRWWNVRDWDTYRRLVLSGATPVEGDEIVEGATRRLERVWLALRTAEGLSLPELLGTEGPGEKAVRLLRSWAEGGLARYEAGWVRLTTRGWLVLDQLATDLVGALPDEVAARGLER